MEEEWKLSLHAGKKMGGEKMSVGSGAETWRRENRRQDVREDIWGVAE